MESLDVGYWHGIQKFKEVPAKGPQLTKGWAVTEKVIDSIQVFLILVTT